MADLSPRVLGRALDAPSSAGDIQDDVPPELAAAIERVRWTPRRVEALIRGLPKAELHVHLDGSLSPELIARLAASTKGSPLAGKTPSQIAKLSVVSENRPSLAKVLEAFDVVYPLLRRREPVSDAAVDLIRRAAGSNVKHVEVRFAPALQAAEGFTAEDALKAALEGLGRASRELGVGYGVIICLLRPDALMDMERNGEMLALALAFQDRGVVGVDLAGDEAAAPLSRYTALLRRAKKAGLGVTVHAGEVPGSSDLETALELGVDRLGHATLLSEKPGALRRVAARRIPIEVNLTSNLRTSAVKDLRRHPARDWLRRGIPLAISTDDPGVFDIGLNHEYQLLNKELGFTPRELVAVALQSVDALFLPPEQRRRKRRMHEEAIRSLLRALESPSSQ